MFRGQETLSFVEYVGKELWSSCKQTIEAWHLVLKAELALCVVQVYVDCIHVHIYVHDTPSKITLLATDDHIEST